MMTTYDRDTYVRIRLARALNQADREMPEGAGGLTLLRAAEILADELVGLECPHIEPAEPARTGQK